MIMCKKSLYYEGGQILFRKGSMYKIRECNDYTVVVYFSNSKGWTTLVKSISPAVRISHPDSFEWHKFYDYFYTLVEVRKMKLNELKLPNK